MERPSFIGPKPEGQSGIRAQLNRPVYVPGTEKKKSFPLKWVIGIIIVLLIVITVVVLSVVLSSRGNGNKTEEILACTDLGFTWDTLTDTCVEPLPQPEEVQLPSPVEENFSYGDWYPWTPCSNREGEGVQKRIRYCTSGNCPAEYELETQPCQQGQTCSHSWTSGTYSGTCSNCDWLRYFYGQGLTGWFWYCRGDKDKVAAQKGYGEFN